MRSGLYAIVHQSSGRRYVGQSINIGRRWQEHRARVKSGVHGSKALAADWLRDGEQAFRLEVIVESADKAELKRLERALLATAENFYNESGPGATGRKPGYKHTPEAVEKMRAVNLGKPKSTAHRAAISAARRGKKFPKHAAALRGRKLSWETRLKMSEAHKRRHAPIEQSS